MMLGSACCCRKRCKALFQSSSGVFFRVIDGGPFYMSPDTDWSRYKILSDYFKEQCPSVFPYNYLDPSLVREYVEAGGYYITNCEWSSGMAEGDPYYAIACDPDGAAFNTHMEAIGSSIRRARGTVTAGSLDGQNYRSDKRMFDSVYRRGNASSEIVGGTTILEGFSHQAYNIYTQPNMREQIEDNTWYPIGSAEIIGNGLVIAFGDSNLFCDDYFMRNLCAFDPEELLDYSPT